MLSALAGQYDYRQFVLALSDEREYWERRIAQAYAEGFANGRELGWDEGMAEADRRRVAMERWVADQVGPLDRSIPFQELERRRWVPKGYRGWLPPQPWRNPDRRLVVWVTHPARAFLGTDKESWERNWAWALEYAERYPGGQHAVQLARRRAERS